MYSYGLCRHVPFGDHSACIPCFAIANCVLAITMLQCHLTRVKNLSDNTLEAKGLALCYHLSETTQETCQHFFLITEKIKYKISVIREGKTSGRKTRLHLCSDSLK